LRRESIQRQHQLVRFAPHQQIAKASGGAFYEHHKHSIEFGYRCFDRLLLNGLIQPFQQPERVLGFFNTYRDGKRVTHRALTEIAGQFLYWLKNRAQKWDTPIVEAPEQQRRDDLVLSY